MSKWWSVLNIRCAGAHGYFMKHRNSEATTEKRLKAFNGYVANLKRLAVILQFISSSSGPLSLCSNVDLTNPTVLVPIIAVCECRSRVLGWHLRIGQCPQEVETLCGWLPPSAGHWKRMTKALRSESLRQVRNFTDCLKVACTSTTNGLVNVKAFREWRRKANNLTEALWNYARPNLPKKQKKVGSEGRLLVPGEATVEERQQGVLKLGPKFCVEPRLDIVDRLALTRDVARYVPEKEKDRCLVECVDVVAKAPVRTRTKPSVSKVASYLVDNNLRVVQSDKEGMLVVLPDALKLNDELRATPVTKVFRYVDDFLVTYECPEGDICAKG
ncbi:uncharacterized protein LOC144160811 [Haemaphysalis longicornis]